MKAIEEAFSSSGFRRVVLPGILVTAGIHPLFAHLAKTWLREFDLSEPAVVLASEVVFFGLIISSATDWVYYVYEGFSLRFLTTIAGKWNERRLTALLNEYEQVLNGRAYRDLDANESIRAAVINERISDYPLTVSTGGQPERFVGSSTLLGNIITTYELYAQSRYHVDGVFYWFHLLALAPAAASKEFHEKYAFAESLVVTSFAGAVVAIINAYLLAAFAVGKLWPRLILATVDVRTARVEGAVILGVGVFIMFYLLALPAHREVAKVFRSIVDLTVKKLDEWSASNFAPVDTGAEWRLAARKRYLNALKH